MKDGPVIEVKVEVNGKLKELPIRTQESLPPAAICISVPAFALLFFSGMRPFVKYSGSFTQELEEAD